MKRRRLIFVVAIVAALQPPSDIFAQTANGQDSTTTDPCKAEPEPEKGAQAERDQNLAEKLDRCNGVLRPPPTEDQEIEEPPPDTGTTPIVPPGELPEQPEPK